MKRFLIGLITVIACALCALGFVGCNRQGGGNHWKVYVPDGAPALSVAGIHGTYRSEKFGVTAVKADTIQGYVTGENPKADFAILPVNAAVKLLGSGEKYTMLGTVTHGNLFLLKKQGVENISAVGDLDKLIGKTVGVINLANVPGLTFKLILNDNGIEFNQLTDGASPVADKVNLRDVKDTQVLPNAGGYDYFVVPEPAASTKVAATGGNLSFAGSLQTLYGGTDGYPQAVAVVKNSVIQKSRQDVSEFIASFTHTKAWLENEDTSASLIVNAVKSYLSGDLKPTFTEQNLNKQVIANCGINFVAAQTCKQEVLTFIQKLNAVSAQSWGTPTDAFFFG